VAGKVGAHKKLLHPARAEEVRQKIRATLLIKKLEDHVLEDGDMNPSQVTAALGLLKKSVPDLAAIELSSDPDKPLSMVIGWMGQPKS